ncbi:outer membrane protein assembly factor BamD [Marinobacter sp. F4218]|uniref:outer membrane protein assembly factor BamD n=1 Tax=Marinobacter sp. F4218 TaxID=2862868 RepID=UPI001E44939A|nr:outer membrane protein assembly factor BamD [Marinobacter sp. F4218]
MKRLLLALLCLSQIAAPSFAQESFRVELGRDGETIGDMRPVFLKFESRPLPAISPAEVARRYQRLFDSSDEPEVRIDALNRLTNIRDRSGQDVGFSPAEEERVYREVIDSYESILSRGSFSGRLDELLYQMAKAHALTGQADQSIERLKQLVGLYPKSELVPEARFRIAESAFSAGDYSEAESVYLTLIDSVERGALKTKAGYMLGWSQFKQGPSAWERSAKTFLSVLDDFLPTPQSIREIDRSSVDTIDDTLRVLALMSARKDGPESLMAWLDDEPERHWAYLLFDRLGDYYAIRGEFDASVQANRAFVRYSPNHPMNPLFMAQIAEVWERAGDRYRVREARANYVAMFESKYADLSGSDQQRWRQFSRGLADFYYEQGAAASADGAPEKSRQAFSTAAEYYEALANRSDTYGELLRLAGDARLQSGEYAEALSDFQKAAYEDATYQEADDAGWAAVVLLREGVDGKSQAPEFRPDLAALSLESSRFEEHFPEDSRLPGLTADLASRWYAAAGNAERALEYGEKTVVNGRASPSERYAGWLTIAKVRQQQGEYELAERSWNHVLDLLSENKINGQEAEAGASVRQQLATAIYRQGEQAAANGSVASAVDHFKRVGAALPNSEIAIMGRYDAANTLLKASELTAAITELRLFRQDFPEHPLAEEVSAKLVHAYVASDRPASAALELLDAAEEAENSWPLKLRAAALFHQAGDTANRNGVYREYLAAHTSADTADQHIQMQTMRHRLLENDTNSLKLQQDLVDRELASQWHSEDTLAWASRSSLALGARAAASFAGIALTHPLPESLDRKQRALALARQRFVDAEKLGGEAVRSESLYRRAELYRVLARDLMASSVPADLNELETMQYQMLLEEEAFPFEEKAIRLHSENHQRVTSRGYDAWIGKSLEVLAELNPGRYDRSVRWMTWTLETNDDAG